MKKTIRRLRLQKDDFIIVKDRETALLLMKCQVGLKLDISIIVAPDGIRRVNRKYLEKILKETGNAGLLSVIADLRNRYPEAELIGVKALKDKREAYCLICDKMIPSPNVVYGITPGHLCTCP